MRDLSALREGWDSIEAAEARLLRALTVQEGVRRWLMLRMRVFRAHAGRTHKRPTLQVGRHFIFYHLCLLQA